MIEDELEKCLRFDTEDPTESNMEKIAREAIKEIRRLRVKMTGWDGYGWKDGEYIDNLDEYFEEKYGRKF